MAFIPKSNKPMSWEKSPTSTEKHWAQGGASFYNSSTWRKLSKAYKAANPLCVECKEKGLIKGADVTDHIMPIIDGGDKLSRGNLQSLCHSCHNSKSATERHLRNKVTK